MIAEEDKKKDLRMVQTLPKWFLIVIIIVMFAIFAFVVYIQLIRYQLVGTAIEASDTTSTALLLSPEISMGLSSILAAL